MGRRTPGDGPTDRPRGLRAVVRRWPVLAFCLLLAAASWPVQLVIGRSVLLAPVGPSVCAFVVVALAEGRSGVRELWGRVLRWRVPLRYHVFALTGLGAGTLAVAYAATAVAFPDRQLAAPSTAVLVSAPINLVAIFVLAGLGEEFGWRGFLQVRLQARRPGPGGPARAALLVGALFAAWHVPLIVVEQDGVTTALLWFTAGTVGISLVYAWLFARTGGSVLLVAMMHAGQNTWTGLLYQDVFSFAPAFFDAVVQVTAVGAGVLTLVLTCGRLGLGALGLRVR